MLADVLIKIASEQGKEEGQSTFKPRPSSAGPERCIRSMVYHAQGVPRAPLPGRAILVFDDSSWHEELTADWINKSAYRLHSRQMKVETPVGPGKIDGIITDILAVDRLWEHKAINHFTFQRVWNGEFPADYFTQCALYVAGLQKVNPAINQALLLVKNKNTAQYLEFLLEYNASSDSLRIVEMVRSDGERQTPDYEYPGITAEAVDKFAMVEQYRLSGKLPPRPFELGAEFPCSYCPWNRTCWEGFAGEFNVLPKDAMLDIEQLVARYQEVKANAAEATKEQKELREQILGKLAQMGVSGGRAGEFIVQAKAEKRKGYVVEETEFITLKISRAKQDSNQEAA